MTHCHMTYLDTKKVLKGRQVDMSFGLAWLCWATNTEEIIFNGLTELQEILHSEWQSSVSTKPKLVDMEDSHGSAVQWNKHCNPPPEQSRIHLEIYTVRRHIYRNFVEFMNGQLFNRTSQIESSTLELHVHTLWPLWTTGKQNPWVLQSW